MVLLFEITVSEARSRVAVSRCSPRVDSLVVMVTSTSAVDLLPTLRLCVNDFLFMHSQIPSDASRVIIPRFIGVLKDH